MEARIFSAVLVVFTLLPGRLFAAESFPLYRIEEFRLDSLGALSVWPRSMSDSAQYVTGQYSHIDGQTHSFLSSSQGAWEVSLPEQQSSGPPAAVDVNSAGQVLVNDGYKTYVWQNGVVTSLISDVINSPTVFEVDGVTLNDRG